MVIVDSVVRLKQGVLPEKAVDIESFSDQDSDSTFLEYPQYTRPEKFKNLTVPKILLSGNHDEIKKWRTQKSLDVTKEKRPDLLKP